jgi:hypothetical protein
MHRNGGERLVPITLLAKICSARSGFRQTLLNDHIRFHQSYKKDEVLQPGRNIRLFASMKF